MLQVDEQKSSCGTAITNMDSHLEELTEKISSQNIKIDFQNKKIDSLVIELATQLHQINLINQEVDKQSREREIHSQEMESQSNKVESQAQISSQLKYVAQHINKTLSWISQNFGRFMSSLFSFLIL